MIVPAPVLIAPAPVVSEKQDDSSWVEQRRSHGHLYETLVFRVNNHLYRFADERIWTDGRESGSPYYLNDYYDPNEDGTGFHDFNMSPDKNWLFVEREFYHGLGVAYLFHFDGKRFVRVHPQGWRFDEAALRHFGRKLHFPVPGLDSGGSRQVAFDQWTPYGGGLVFCLTECQHTRRQRNERFVVITAQYDFRSRRFKPLKVDDERDKQREARSGKG